MTKPERAEPSVPAPAASESPDKSDVAIIHGVTEDGTGYKLLRHRDGRLEAGAARPLKEGQPIVGEVVRLKPRPDTPLVYDVETDYAPPTPKAESRKGPAQVASERYRQNWDAIWRRRSELN